MMGWRIIKNEELPLGLRVLTRGCVGKDVAELQKSLSSKGFYRGEVDGRYGILTEEAVYSAQRSYKLRGDGRAGPQLLAALNNSSAKIIFTLGDDFKAGQQIQNIGDGYQIESSGELTLKRELGAGEFLAFSTGGDVWKEVLTSRKKQLLLGENLRKFAPRNFGFDLRNSSINLIAYWPDFLKKISRKTEIGKISFVILPLPVSEAAGLKRFRLYLPDLCGLARMALLEAWPDMTDKRLFEAGLANFPKFLTELGRKPQFAGVIPVLAAQGWEWDEAGSTFRRRVAYKEARLIHALNFRTATYRQSFRSAVVNYRVQGRPRQIIYHDQKCWSEWIELIKRSSFPGVAVRDPAALGDVFSKLIAGML